MKDFRTQKSRQLNPNRSQPTDILPVRRNIFLTLLLSLLVLLPAFFSISCKKLPSPSSGGEEAAVVDSTLTVLKFGSACEYPVKSLQVLVYKSEGTRSLEKMMTFEELPDSVEIMTTAGEKLVAAVANSSRALSPVALDRYDSLKGLGYDFSDEDTALPVMSGQCATVRNNGEITLFPLLCEVEISSISNSMENYELAESPRVRLVNLNSYAAVMQEDGFVPTEFMDYGEWQELPFDIGMFTQEPGTTLYCYPNETDHSGIGGIRTSLELECTISYRLPSVNSFCLICMTMAVFTLYPNSPPKAPVLLCSRQGYILSYAFRHRSVESLKSTQQPSTLMVLLAKALLTSSQKSLFSTSVPKSRLEMGYSLWSIIATMAAVLLSSLLRMMRLYCGTSA